MEQWLVPLVSLVTAAEWLTLWWIRRDGRRPAMTDEQLRDRLSLIDLIIALVCVGLFISALQYPGIANGQDARIALGVVRVMLLLIGTDLLWREVRSRGRNRGG